MSSLNLAQEIFDLIYPVGSIYMSVNSINPGTLFGGTWSQLKDRFLLGAGDTYSNGATGGSATHTLTVDQIPSHSHTISGGDHNHKLPVDLSDKDSPGNYDYFKYDGWGYSSYYNLTKWDGSHSHVCSDTGGSEAHNNMPPYLVVYIWKRTA